MVYPPHLSGVVYPPHLRGVVYPPSFLCSNKVVLETGCQGSHDFHYYRKCRFTARMLLSFLCHCNTMPDKISMREERLFLASRYQGALGLWS